MAEQELSKPSRSNISAVLRRGLELTADGQWHPWQEVLDQTMVVVTDDHALAAGKTRAVSLVNKPSYDKLMELGRRYYAQHTLRLASYSLHLLKFRYSGRNITHVRRTTVEEARKLKGVVPYPEKMSAWGRYFLEQLHDGKWHKLEPLMYEAGLQVPPGRAFRRGETERLTKLLGDGTRKRGDYWNSVNTGRRRYIKRFIEGDALRQQQRIEYKWVDDVKYVRLTNYAMKEVGKRRQPDREDKAKPTEEAGRKLTDELNSSLEEAERTRDSLAQAERGEVRWEEVR